MNEMEFGFNEVYATLNLKQFLITTSVVPSICLALYVIKSLLSLFI